MTLTSWLEKHLLVRMMPMETGPAMSQSGPPGSFRAVSLAQLLQGVIFREARVDLTGGVAGICYDSRKVEPGMLFVALRGAHVDGHQYVSEVLGRGACAALVEEFVGAGQGQILVTNTLQELARVAANAYRHPAADLQCIGLTGTNGKSTSTYILEAILGAARWSPGVIGTIDYRWAGKCLPAPHTTPFSLELQQVLRHMADDGVTHAVMEVSSHALVLHRVDGIQFSAALFTNLTPEHLAFHQTMEEYGRAKARLFEHYLAPDGWSVVNRDDEFGRRLLSRLPPGRTIDFGLGRYARVRPAKYELRADGLVADITTPWGRFEIESHLMGRHNLYNLLGAIAVAQTMGVKTGSIIEGIAHLEGVPGRLQSIRCGQDFQVLVDYAHTSDGLRQVLGALNEVPHERLICLFGCGGDRDRGKRPAMGHIAQELADVAIITSDNPRSEDPLKIIEEIRTGLDPGNTTTEILVEPDRHTAIERAVGLCRAGDILLVAGKGHEDYMILADKTIHFDDREQVTRAIQARQQQEDSHD